MYTTDHHENCKVLLKAATNGLSLTSSYLLYYKLHLHAFSMYYITMRYFTSTSVPNIGSVFVLFIVKAAMLHLGNSCIFYDFFKFRIQFPRGESYQINKTTTY
jgi:hypothetical protein